MAAIVVGVDGSEASKDALRWAIGEARLRRAGVLAVYAWPTPFIAAGTGSVMVPTFEEIHSDAQELLDTAIADVGADGVDVECACVQGSPARALVEAAEGADLLVVGSRGHGGFTGLLLGSVGQQCSHHATCPVVIVHGSRTARPGA